MKAPRVVAPAATTGPASRDARHRATLAVEPADLASALRIAVGRLQRRLRAERSDETLTITTVSALATLERCGPQSPTALAALERVQPPSMTRIISALEERGLAERVAHPSDRRQSVIAVTAHGLSLLREDRRRRDVWLAQGLERLDPADLRALARALPVLERLIET